MHYAQKNYKVINICNSLGIIKRILLVSETPQAFNYSEALSLSILFFDAQRSGLLPVNNPIPWRNDSAVDDHGDNGEDLSGGWYNGELFPYLNHGIEIQIVPQPP